MPQGVDWWNPYRLVPIREGCERRAPATHEAMSGYWGTIECELENLSLLNVGANQLLNRRPFARIGQQPVIPGSSLKGALRSLAELFGGGCAITQGRGRPEACARHDQLCITCRMFGWMGRGRNARVHAGKVQVGDGRLMLGEGERARFVTKKILMGTPKPTHTAFYPDSSQPRHRKMYFHRAAHPEEPAAVPGDLISRAWDVEALTPRHRFRFDVRFQNLEEDELALLLFTLHLHGDEELEVVLQGEGNTPPRGQVRLRGPLRHKIGHGKAVGLGSVAIHVRKLNHIDRSQGLGALRRFDGEDLESLIAEKTADYRNDGFPTMVQARKMMVWDPHDPRDIRYPSYSWLKSNSRVPLKPI